MFIAWGIEASCSVAVNCYVLISGYFLVDAKFSWNKLIKLIVEVWFYSIVFFIVLLGTGKMSFSTTNLFATFFPILNRTYWFVSSYICLYILSPFITMFLLQLDQKSYRRLLLTLYILFSVIPTFYPFEDTFQTGGGSGVAWFFVLYFTAAYIKRYGHSILWNYKRFGFLYLSGVLLVSASQYFIAFVTQLILHKSLGTSIFYGYNSPFIALSSIALFLYFEKMPEIKYRKIGAISKVATSTFGVYLIHDNPMLRPVLWGFFSVNTEGNIFLFIFNLSVIVFVVFVCCVAIDLVRMVFFSLLGIDKTISNLRFKGKVIE